MNIPNNLDEAITALDELIICKEKEIILDWKEEKFVTSLHHTLGRQIRNGCKLWGTPEDNKLVNWFNQQGIKHADDMSGIILTSYYLFDLLYLKFATPSQTSSKIIIYCFFNCSSTFLILSISSCVAFLSV